MSDEEERVEEFESEPEEEPKPLTGRRLKAHKEQKKKNRPGTFGGCSRPGRPAQLVRKTRLRMGSDAGRSAAKRRCPSPAHPVHAMAPLCRVHGPEPIADQGHQAQRLPAADTHPAQGHAPHPAGKQGTRREGGTTTTEAARQCPACTPHRTQAANPHPPPVHPPRQGLDVIGMARTGSGKTAAFVLPMLERLKAHSPKAGARAVILAPTRELALQTHKVGARVQGGLVYLVDVFRCRRGGGPAPHPHARRSRHPSAPCHLPACPLLTPCEITPQVVRELSKGTDLRTAVLVGGDSMEAQFAELAQVRGRGAAHPPVQERGLVWSGRAA